MLLREFGGGLESATFDTPHKAVGKKLSKDIRMVQRQILVTIENLWCHNNRSVFEKLNKINR
jgi:hypothetical protein